VDGRQVHALIPAAGRSVRFGGTTLKQYAHLNGRPVMAHSISAITRPEAVTSLTVALAPDDGIFDDLIRPSWPDISTVAGGDSRARTVMNGLEFIRAHHSHGQSDWVLVHDAARPCLSSAALERLLLEGLDSEHGAILAMPVSDTLKMDDGSGCIVKTIDRSRCWAAQTPQLFPLAALTENLAAALAAGESPTDEAAAMERAGARPKLVLGSATNIKVTGAEDLSLAEFILNRQSVRE